MCVRTRSVVFVVRFPETGQKHIQTHAHVHAETRTHTDTQRTAGQSNTDRCGELRNPTVQGLSGECGRTLSRNDSQNVQEKHTHCVHAHFTLLLGRPGSPGSNSEGVAALDRGAETHTHTHTRTHTHAYSQTSNIRRSTRSHSTHAHTHTHTRGHPHRNNTPQGEPARIWHRLKSCAHTCAYVFGGDGAQCRGGCLAFHTFNRLA